MIYVIQKSQKYKAPLPAEHHKKQSFRDEYLEFLRLYEIEYNENYVFSD